MEKACSSTAAFAHSISRTLVFQSLAQVSGIGSAHFLGQTYLEVLKPAEMCIKIYFFFEILCAWC